MGAAIGNKYAQKWTEETVMDKLNELLIEAETACYIGEGLSNIGLYAQWYSEMLEKFKDNDNVSETIKRIDQKFEARIVSKTMKGDFNATMAIFTLKNKHQWKDKTEVANTNINYNSTELTPDEIKKIDATLENEV